MLDDCISDETVSTYQAQLLYLMSKLSKGSTINIYINSPGGNVYAGLGLYDTINYAKNKGFIIKTINIGSACSMAALILMSGSKGYRYGTPNSSVLIHELSGGVFDKMSCMKDSIEEATRLQTALNNIIATNANPDLIEACLRKDLWLDADKAISYNVIDSILK